VILPLLLLILQLPSDAPPADLAEMAEESYRDGNFPEAAEIWLELLQRMPHRGRLAYNFAAATFMMDSLAYADSALSIAVDCVGDDTLSTAVSLTDLALAIQSEDYSGVESAVFDLMTNVSDGISPECERTGLEAGLNWLENHEPPEDQQDQNDDQQDQNDDQQDQNDDQQDQNEDQQDQNDDQQDQNDDQQDQNEDQQDQNEDQQDQNEDQQDQNQDQQDQNNDQQDQNGEQPPPQIDEMTPEQAQAILDMVEENESPSDSTGKGKIGYPSGPVW
jgi:hypothetical protein